MNARYVLVGAALLLSCGQKPGHVEMDLRHNPSGAGQKVATFNQDSISAEQVKQLLLEMNPYARSRYQEPAQRKEYVQGLARFELLAAEAAKRGMANDPEVVLAAKKVMVQKLLGQELDEKPTPVSDQDVQKYYEQRKADYVKPEMVRLTHLFLAAPPESPERAAKLEKAKELLAKAQALPPLDYQAFAALVREHSEDEKSKPIDGDLRFLSFEELTQQLGAPVAEAAKALTQVGQLADAVVATDKGLHLLKLQGRQAALNLTVDQVKPQIQNTLIQQQRMALYQKLLESLEARYQLQIDQAALDGLKLDFAAPTAQTRGPQPGFVPPPTPSESGGH